LKLGIHRDIGAVLGDAVDRYYVSNIAYRKSRQAGVDRIDLDGNAAGVVTELEAVNAQKGVAQQKGMPKTVETPPVVPERRQAPTRSRRAQGVATESFSKSASAPIGCFQHVTLRPAVAAPPSQNATLTACRKTAGRVTNSGPAVAACPLVVSAVPTPANANAEFHRATGPSAVIAARPSASAAAAMDSVNP
jgi:sRNA-binding protein